MIVDLSGLRAMLMISPHFLKMGRGIEGIFERQKSPRDRAFGCPLGERVWSARYCVVLRLGDWRFVPCR